MVHLKVPDADRAMAFYEAIFGWQAERVLVEGHVSHYTINTDVTVRILEGPSVPPVVPNYAVSDVAEAIRTIPAAGGTVASSEVNADGGGWAQGTDDQGLPLLVYRPGPGYPHREPTRHPTGQVGLVFITADAARADRFYGSVLGWHLERAHAASNYLDAVPHLGVFDATVASGQRVAPSVRLYLAVEAIAPVVSRIEQLGGHSGPIARDMGPYLSTVCSDDQGTEFGLISDRLVAEGPPAPTLTPSLACDDAHGLIHWLVDLLEFHVAELHEEPGGGVAHAVLSWRNGNIFLSSRRLGVWGEVGPATICLAKDDPAEVDRLYQKALAANAEIVEELTDADYGSHEFGLRDPEGNLWAIGTYRPPLGPTVQ
jgi:predicted enzyme related to lactoylglutathione lyase